MNMNAYSAMNRFSIEVIAIGSFAAGRQNNALNNYFTLRTAHLVQACMLLPRF